MKNDVYHIELWQQPRTIPVKWQPSNYWQNTLFTMQNCNHKHNVSEMSSFQVLTKNNVHHTELQPQTQHCLNVLDSQKWQKTMFITQNHNHKHNANGVSSFDALMITTLLSLFTFLLWIIFQSGCNRTLLNFRNITLNKKFLSLLTVLFTLWPII